jgi:hypothetical protein
MNKPVELYIAERRAEDPSFGGLVLSFAGPPAVFMINAVSVVGVMYTLYRWKPTETKKRLPPQHFLPAIRIGIRYVRFAPVLRFVLARSVAFFLFGSAGWALLPLVARQELGVGPGGYGLLLTSIGSGAVAGALLLPKIRQALGADRLVALSSLTFALTMLALAFMRHFWLLASVPLFAGFAWIAVLSTLNVGAQRSTASWVKARALAAYLTVLYGSMTAGSTLWGQTASFLGVTNTFVIAAIGMAIASLIALRWRLETSPDLDLTPAELVPLVSMETDNDRGPVMIQIDYEVNPSDAIAFEKLHRNWNGFASAAARFHGRCMKTKKSRIFMSRYSLSSLGLNTCASTNAIPRTTKSSGRKSSVFTVAMWHPLSGI